MISCRRISHKRVQLDIHFPYHYILNFLSQVAFCPICSYIPTFGPCFPYATPPFVTRQSLTDQFGIHDSYFLLLLLLPLLPIAFPSFSVIVTLTLGSFDKFQHTLDNLICHSWQGHVWQVLAVALSSGCSRVPEHVRLLHEFVR